MSDDEKGEKKKGIFNSLKRKKKGRKNFLSRSLTHISEMRSSSRRSVNFDLRQDKTHVLANITHSDEKFVSQTSDIGHTPESPSSRPANLVFDGESSQEFGPGSTAASVAKTGKFAFFALMVELKEGINLAARDKTVDYHIQFFHDKPYTKTITRTPGTSDPYVKFKADGKQIYKSRTIPKNLNPQWNEKFCVPIEDISMPLVIKVFDFDRVSSDDPMGTVVVDLSMIEVNKPRNLTLDLQNANGTNEKLGQITVIFTLTPKTSDDRQELIRKANQRRATQSKESGKAIQKDGIVSVTLVEGKKLIAMDDNGLSDPYCRFKLGNEKHKSKACKDTLNPQWKEHFDLKFFVDTDMILEVSIYDRDIRKDEFMGRVSIDLNKYERERSHKIEAKLEDGAGVVVMYVAVTAIDIPGCESDLNSYIEQPNRREEIEKQYSLKKTGKNIKDIGWLQVKLHRAVGLAAADIGGTSDPFAIIELNNARLVTPTIFKSLNPQWEKVYEFNVKDIHDMLEIGVFDEDKRGSPDLLGKVAIPLLQITPREKRMYQLKDKTLEKRVKGHLIMTLDVIYNPIKAAIRTINPREPKVLYEPPKFKRQLLQRNIDRIGKIGASVASTGAFVASLFTWQYKFRSAFAFLVYIMLVLNFSVYLFTLGILLAFLKQYVVHVLLSERNVSPEDQEGPPQDEDDDDDDDDEDMKKKGDKGKSFKEKMAMITSLCQTIQNALDNVASLLERVKNLFNWTVPFVSTIVCVAMTGATVLLYFVPIKFVLLAYGINKFTKKIRKPNAVDNNELLDLLSRLPSDPQIKEQKLLKTDPALRLKRLDP
ncbi:multiple C2 and transmembrane domain-containing protein 1-like isoform X2 [Xenia sp. Carnegie-2017]|uniref:multiple C2 and transmembrane domain-containing protein 1-like isoform X2 n=1 Tax=Xenia sp. Carnegie-2017 TaxID=2897299 RepID=UPI001F043BDC|nr:multiple C2 and transmembrane domain-containing protein 1-like isoform X2 [Xenia sp. Carnegie-2017]